MGNGLPDFTKPLGSASYSIGTKTSAGTVNDLTNEEIDTSGGPVTRTLPLASANTGRLFRIIKKTGDANAVTIAVTGSDHILTNAGQVTSLTISSIDALYELISDGALWVNLTPPGATFGVTPSTQAFGDSATEGTSGGAARGDHKHGMPVGWTLAQTLSLSGVNTIDSSVFSAHDLWQIIIDIVIAEAVETNMYLRFNGDSGATYASRWIDTVTITQLTNITSQFLGTAVNVYHGVGSVLVTGKRKGTGNIIVIQGGITHGYSGLTGIDGLYAGATDVTKFTIFGGTMTGKIKIFYMDY